MPTLRYCKAPKMLGGISNDNWRPNEIQDLEGRGLYTKEEIDDYTNSINFPIERGIILDSTAEDIKEIREIHDIPSTENFLDYYIKKHANEYWNEFKDFGAASAAICTIVALLLLITFIINTIINAFQIKKITGYSIKLGASIFSSLTNKIISTAREHQSNPKTKTENFELTEIQSQKHLTSKIPVPKPRTKFTRFIPNRLSSKRIHNRVKIENTDENIDLDQQTIE